jgi:hypothetical protein
MRSSAMSVRMTPGCCCTTAPFECGHLHYNEYSLNMLRRNNLRSPLIGFPHRLTIPRPSDRSPKIGRARR